MEDNLKQMSELFETEQKNFYLAEEKYRKAFKQFKPLAILESLPTPPIHRAAYSDRMAWIMAHMARLAYIKFEDSQLERERLEYCLSSGWFNLIKTFNKNGSQAFLAKNDEFVVLAFRGTQPDRWEDIRTDIRILKLKTVNGKVHVGFKMAFDELKDAITTELRKHLGEMPLYITGHSLGAALATVAAHEMEEEFEDQVAACYTFGSPRVGDGRFEKAIKVPFYRIVNATDIVTLIPFLLGSFVHVGDARYLSRRKVNDIYVLYRGMPSFARLWDSTLETLSALFHLANPISPWIKAHDMEIYIDKLERYAKSRNTSAQE